MRSFSPILAGLGLKLTMHDPKLSRTMFRTLPRNSAPKLTSKTLELVISFVH